MPNIATRSIPCPVCKYPIQEPIDIGQQVKCPYCDTINEAIAQVTTSNAVLIGIGSFVAGILFGHAALAAARAGSTYLEKKTKQRFER